MKWGSKEIAKRAREKQELYEKLRRVRREEKEKRDREVQDAIIRRQKQLSEE